MADWCLLDGYDVLDRHLSWDVTNSLFDDPQKYKAFRKASACTPILPHLHSVCVRAPVVCLEHGGCWCLETQHLVMRTLLDFAGCMGAQVWLLGASDASQHNCVCCNSCMVGSTVGVELTVHSRLTFGRG